METIDATTSGSTHHQRTASRSRYPWFRKSKSETDKESWQRGRAISTRAVTASSNAATASLSSSTSSTAASGVLHRRADTMSSSSSHDITTVARATSSAAPRLVKHVAVQCSLVADHCTMTSHAGGDVTTTTLPNEKVSSGMCVDMEAVYRGSSHQRRKAIAIAATDDETLLTQHPVNYRSVTSLFTTVLLNRHFVAAHQLKISWLFSVRIFSSIN